MHRRRALALAFAGTLLALAALPTARPAQQVARPNIVFVLTDDQSPAMLARMAYLDGEPEGHWVRFTNAFVSYPLCCPSRATILTGLYPHHHGVTGNSGGALRDASTVATWLDGVGYTTGLFGKYLNGYPFSGRPSNYVPPGWDEWAAFRDQAYYSYQLNENGTWVSYGSAAADYSTDVLARKATGFVSSAAQPFFLFLSTHAPHTSYAAAPRHKGAFATLPIPHAPNFNEADVSDKPAWVRNLSAIDEAAMTRRERGASETLLAVDEGIRSILEALKSRGVLENTVIVFMTDNGYLFGNHRWNHKRAAYEESIRTPLLVRYPGAAERDVAELVVNTDIAPTLAELGGTSVPYAPDGQSLVPFLTGSTPTSWRTSVLLHYQAGDSPPPPWWGVRTERWKYVELSTGERELYDLAADPYELVNVAGKPEYAATQSALADELRRLRATGSSPPPPPPANRAPVASADTYATPPDTPLTVSAPGVLANDSDPEGDPLTAALVSGVAAGDLTLNADGSLAYTPPTGFTGEVSFTYKASDGSAQSPAASVTIGVGTAAPPLRLVPTADAYVRSNYPSENTGSQSTIRVYKSGSTETQSYLRFVVPPLGAAVTRAAVRVFVDRASTVGGALYPVTGGWDESTITWVSRPLALGPKLATLPAAETLGTWIETDLTSAVRGPGTYDLVLKDGGGATWYSSREGAHPPELLVSTGGTPPANRAPSAAADSYTTPQDTSLVVAASGVLANDSDADGDPLTAVKTTDPANGSVTLSADGSFTYTPGAGFTGSDSFTYRAFDGTDESNEATATITVTPSGGGGGGGPAMTTVTPTQDAYVRSNFPTENTGSQATVRVYKSGSTETHSFLQFTVPALPGPVTAVKLRLFVTRSSSVGGTLYPASNAWSASTITWTSRLAATGPALATVGPVTTTNAWVEVDLTGDIAGAGTYTFLLKDGGPAAWFGSSESATPPALAVTTS